MSEGPWVAACLVALAAAVTLLPARRSPWGETPRAPARLTRSARSAPTRPEVDTGLLLTEVAGLLRVGVPPPRAWVRALGRYGVTEGAAPGQDGVPAALLDLGSQGTQSWLPRWEGRRLRWEPPVRGAAAQRRRAAAAAVPGAAAACRLSTSLGAPLADVLDAVAAGVAESGHAESSRATALTGPRTTARLLAGLPLAGLVLGALVGADPAAVLLDGGWGSALGAAGVLLMVVGHHATRRLVRAATAPAGGVDEALVLDLAAAALCSGASLPGALGALGQALGQESFGVVGRALLLGAQWEEAWEAPQDPAWSRRQARLQACLRPGWEDGASPVPLLAASAATLRAGRRADDEEAAERLAVRLVLPLGACHLPAFVILGIVPVVASVGMDILVS